MGDTDTLSLPIIGVHHSPLTQKFGLPRQPNLVAVPSAIEMLAPYNTPDAFVGLNDFSHLWVVWQTHGNREQATFKPKVRPPRLGGNQKLGVFATRSTYRPSQLGLSVVALERLDIKNGVLLHITGADMVDGTPIVDIKPYVAYGDALPHAMSGFAPNPPTAKPVRLTVNASDQFKQLVELEQLLPSDLAVIQALIGQDPRPAYRQAEVGAACVMRYREVDIAFVQTPMGEMQIDYLRHIEV